MKTEKAVDFIQSTPYIPPVKTDEEQLSAPLDSPQIKSLSQIADLLRQHKKLLLAFGVENYIRPIKIEESVLTCAFSEGAPPTLGRDLTNFLKEITGKMWTITLQKNTDANTIHEKKEIQKENNIKKAQQHSVVAAILSTFPAASITRITNEPSANLESVESDIKQIDNTL